MRDSGGARGDFVSGIVNRHAVSIKGPYGIAAKMLGQFLGATFTLRARVHLILALTPCRTRDTHHRFPQRLHPHPAAHNLALDVLLLQSAFRRCIGHLFVTFRC